MRVRRKLDVGSDGTAELLLLTDPIPRHVSIVDWGASDFPSTSWKAADPTAAHHVLRSPPSGKITSAETVDGPTLEQFISETLDAWATCISAILSNPLQPGDRAAQSRALTVQAGARIAAALKVLGAAAALAAAAHKAAGLKIPEIPTAPTLEGEIDRKRLQSAIESAVEYLFDFSLEAAKLASGSTEAILYAFDDVASSFSKAFSSLPAGVVGAASATVRSALTFSETPMELTLKQLETLLSQDPVGTLKAINNAVDAAKKSGAEGVQVAKKFVWGETGVDPYDPAAVLAGLVGFQDGTALQSAIATAVGGIDVAKATGTGVAVAATMRKGIRALLVAELKADPNGELATAIKATIASDVGEAVVQTVRRALDGGHGASSNLLSFEPAEGTDVNLTPDIPGFPR